MWRLLIDERVNDKHRGVVPKSDNAAGRCGLLVVGTDDCADGGLCGRMIVRTDDTGIRLGANREAK